MTATILRVALPLPMYCLFDYLPPEGITPGSLSVGSRLRVPFGKSERIGVLMEWVAESAVPRDKLRHITEILDAQALLDVENLVFLSWVANYYQHPVGEVICAALPVLLRKGKAPVSEQASGWAITVSGLAVDLASLTRAPKQVTLLQRLRQHPAGMSRQALADIAGDVRPILNRMRDKGWVESVLVEAVVELAAETVAPPVPTPEQQQAIDVIQQQLGDFAVALLEGLTGSGKTEVYLRAAEQVLSGTGSVLVLVPEIALTPQLVARFGERLDAGISVLHSGMNDRQRSLAWQQAQSGRHRLVIGTRSAIFAPMPHLELIIVDEEHDGSFKQQEGCRYSARDLAVVRARRSGCPVVLGSATPSLETLRNAQSGKYLHLKMHQRPGLARLPDIDLIDCSSQKMQSGLSGVMLKVIRETLEKGQQVLMFLNRRGFAPVLGCYSCGWLSDCARCDARQTVHARNHTLWCHHCGSQRPLPQYCPACNAQDLHPLGQGTEQLEQTLQQLFPDYPLIRIDRDATRRKGSLESRLDAARDGTARIILGTQMLAKGHDFPGVTLVGILDVDGGLFGADFRAGEKMAQLVTQVAGRSGRGEHPGRVLIQSRYPDHPLLQILVKQGYDAFARQALQERREAQLPPYSFQALLRADSGKPDQAQAFLQEVVTASQQVQVQGVAIWGPVPAPMQRRAGRYREHLLFQADDRGQLQAFLSRLLLQIPTLPAARRVRWSIDVDPHDLH